MGLKVFLCEKPDQGKTIAAVLSNGKGRMLNGYIDCGNDTVVTWAVGHVLELAEPEAYDEALIKRENIATLPVIPETWKLKIIKDKKKVFDNVRAQVIKATEVVIAADAGREGELIARLILQKCGFKGKVSRMWFQALNKTSIQAALANILPGEKTVGLFKAGQARSHADWLIGMNMSRVMTAAYGDYNKGGYPSSISVGRIQTPTLAIVVARDSEIDSFVSKAFFNLTATFKHVNGEIKASYVLPESSVDAVGHCVDVKLLEQVKSDVSGQSGVVVAVETEAKKELAPLPYDLSSLQQEMSKRLKISVKQVLDIAQVLYEKHKIVSYPRVDSRYLVESMFKDVPAIFESIIKMDESVGDLVKHLDPSMRGRAWNDAQVEKSDHHAIMPLAVDGVFDLSVLSQKELVVYKAIRDRFLMQFAGAHEFDATQLTIECANEKFVATGKAVRFLGWKGLFEVKSSDAERKKKEESVLSLPVVAKGDSISCLGSDITNGKTKPPERFTEGTLLAAMENVAHLVTDARLKKVLSASGGLGTPATRADTIEGLKFKKLLVEHKGIGKSAYLMSSERSRDIIKKLPDVLTQPETTALWEIALEEIAKGKMTYDDFMKQQVAFIEKLVAFAKDVAAKREPHKF